MSEATFTEERGGARGEKGHNAENFKETVTH